MAELIYMMNSLMETGVNKDTVKFNESKILCLSFLMKSDVVNVDKFIRF